MHYHFRKISNQQNCAQWGLLQFNPFFAAASAVLLFPFQDYNYTIQLLLSQYSTDSIIIHKCEQFWIFAPTSYNTLHTRLQRYKSQQMWAKKFTDPFQQLLILWFSSKLHDQSIFGFADSSREMEMQNSGLWKSRLGEKYIFSQGLICFLSP